MENRCKGCGNCCCETEMTLSARDIARIIKNSHDSLKPIDFTKKTNDGLFQLKNVKGRCYFLDSKSQICKIYEVRPQGCRFYPLIFDSHTKLCVLDEDCPKPELFYPTSKSRVNTCKNIIKFLFKSHLYFSMITIVFWLNYDFTIRKYIEHYVFNSGSCSNGIAGCGTTYCTSLLVGICSKGNSIYSSANSSILVQLTSFVFR